ncbi:OmpP1/FadL family transporter [Thaumasiovibrio subtropicus]|uniref:OmpP1/FadL family transporter n=1 Tax=Thaumasiovibrio subtropicus TaxID=1891207 RepID=UPI000B358BD9|nr:outer membrane protein transport protein [Thaumasiovibrio subtropicus]
MTGQRLRPLVAAIGLASLTPSLSQAAGFQLNEHSVSGLGRAYAGEAASVENSSVIFRNPAAMTYYDTVAISAGAVYIDPNVDIHGTNMLGKTGDTDVASSGLLPNVSVVKPLNADWAVGFSASSNFHTGVEFSDDFLASHFGKVAEIETMDLNLAIAYKINEAWSLGLGLSAIKGEGRIKSTTPPVLPAPYNNLTSKTILDLQGDDTTTTWNLGAMWQVNEKHRLALTYKHHATLDLSGTATSDIGMPSGNGSLPLALPAMAEIASEHQLRDNLILHASLNWTGWSRFEELRANIEGHDVLIKDENWDDTWRASVGITYRLNSEWQLRSGLAFDKGAVKEDYRTITIPDSDRYWFSTGAAYHLSKHSTIDLGLSYLHFKDASIEETTQIGNIVDTYQATASGDVWLIGAQYSYRF